MRKKLEAAGVRQREIAELLLHGDDELHFEIVSENGLIDPSNQPSGEKAKHGKKRRVR
jgi:hypothetical protein